MIKVTLVSTPNCSHCLEVKKTLEKMKREYPELTVEEISALTEDGQKLIHKHGIMSSPGVLINNEFFSMGIVTEKQFKEKFDSLR
ncbi:MAG: thioredoxin family protein [Candidatus Yonathbacteria bacterium]|nr:thioredoxin family protein [Candidatus Yonathbacteria bacterium]